MAEPIRPLYKKLLRLAQSLPAPKRQKSIDQIRREFRTHGDLTDPKECVVVVSCKRVQSLVNESLFVHYLLL